MRFGFCVIWVENYNFRFIVEVIRRVLIVYRVEKRRRLGIILEFKYISGKW